MNASQCQITSRYLPMAYTTNFAVSTPLHGQPTAQPYFKDSFGPPAPKFGARALQELARIKELENSLAQGLKNRDKDSFSEEKRQAMARDYAELESEKKIINMLLEQFEKLRSGILANFR